MIGPVVLNKHRVDPELLRLAVYIGRGSCWGNPFRIGRDGNRFEVIAAYQHYLRDPDQRQLLAWLPRLRGRDLYCFCAPWACHGDLLVWLANTDRANYLGWKRGKLEMVWPSKEIREVVLV